MLSFQQIQAKVARAVYAYDQPGRADHYVRACYTDHAIVYETYSEKHFRVDIEVGDQDVVVAPRAEWTQVEQVWQEVTDAERALMKERKLASGLAPFHQDLSTEERRTGEVRTFQPHFQPEIRMSSDDNRSTFLIMTDQLARDGMIVERDGLDVSAYLTNPVVLYDHGHHPVRGSVPIARSVSLVKKDLTRAGQEVRAWLATVEWEMDDFARDIRDKVKRGTISTASIRWSGQAEMQNRDGQRVPVYTRSELLEFSVVGVPGDAAALVTERSGDTSSAAEDTSANRATAPAASTESEPSATADRSAPEAPADQREVETPRYVTLAEIREAQRLRRERALEKAKQRLGRA